MNESPFISDHIDHGNFISEYQCNIDCKQYIDHFERMTETGGMIQPRLNPLSMKDSSIYVHNCIHDNIMFSIYNDWNLLSCEALKHYMNTYDVLKTRDFEHKTCKIQKTNPSEGFHQWHYDGDSLDSYTSFRQLVVMIYLNDDFENGETEFLYQQTRITPKEGKFIIFPCSWPWTHRGNPPIGGSKYIITSWIEEFPKNSHSFKE